MTVSFTYENKNYSKIKEEIFNLCGDSLVVQRCAPNGRYLEDFEMPRSKKTALRVGTKGGSSVFCYEGGRMFISDKYEEIKNKGLYPSCFLEDGKPKYFVNLVRACEVNSK